MDNELYLIELKRLADTRKETLRESAGHDFRRRRIGAVLSRRRFFEPRHVWIPMVLAAGFTAWMLPSGPSVAESQNLNPPSLDASTALNALWFNPAITATPASFSSSPTSSSEGVNTSEDGKPSEIGAAPEAGAPAEAAAEASPVDGLKISSQSWRRGGLGSNAQITFTLQNTNDYAVKDVEISCAFTRRDGSHLTDRSRIIADSIGMKTRKTFARMHVGFVNVNASSAKCALVTATRL